MIATAQLMLVLDDTVANITLPSIGRDLVASATTLPSVVTAYVQPVEIDGSRYA